MKDLKRVKYKVTGSFGDLDEGDIIESLVLLETDCSGSVLLYHPKTDRACCASIEMCHMIPAIGLEGDHYVSSCQDSDDYGWVNVEGQKHITKLVKALSKITYRKTK